MAAVTKVQDGWTQAEVAAFLGVHPVTVAKWVARLPARRRRRTGRQADTRTAPVPDRRARSSRSSGGWPTSRPHGFRTDLWTARRVADLIRAGSASRSTRDYLREWLCEAGLHPAEAGPPGPAAEPTGHRPVAGGGLAADSKKASAAQRPPRPDRRDRAVPQPARPAVVGDDRAGPR